MKRIGQALGAVSLMGAAYVALPGRPAQAQSRSIPIFTVFGNDPCPRDYICVRVSENERYRIPKELRGETGLAAAERWGDRVQALEYAGASGINSCSPVGAGGASGCFRQLTQQARAEQRQRGQQPTIPLNLP
jgi:hypothetical protein